MLEDINRTLTKCFDWVSTVLPLGLKFFAIAVAAAAVFLFFDLRTLGVVCLLAGCFCAYFFRDPKRNTVFAEDEIACPADGTVLSITGKLEHTDHIITELPQPHNSQSAHFSAHEEKNRRRGRRLFFHLCLFL